MFLHEELGSVATASLLVDEHEQDDLAGQLGCPGLRPHEHREHHRGAALHVEPAASPDVAVGDIAGEWRGVDSPSAGTTSTSL
jgi:hypothetical protein